MVSIIRGFPPNFSEIKEKFPRAVSPGVLFSWGDLIYNPSGFDVPPYLMAHEAVHQGQQGDDVKGWWDRYISDPVFRFEQELEAHLVEYQWFRDNGNRRQKRAALDIIAGRLSGPLYGKMISRFKAETLLRKGTEA